MKKIICFHCLKAQRYLIENQFADKDFNQVQKIVFYSD